MGPQLWWALSQGCAICPQQGPLSGMGSSPERSNGPFFGSSLSLNQERCLRIPLWTQVVPTHCCPGISARRYKVQQRCSQATIYRLSRCKGSSKLPLELDRSGTERMYTPTLLGNNRTQSLPFLAARSSNQLWECSQVSGRNGWRFGPLEIQVPAVTGNRSFEFYAPKILQSCCLSGVQISPCAAIQI